MPGCLRFLSSLPDAQFSVIIYIFSDSSKRQWEDDELINKIGFSKDDQIGFMKQKSIDQFGKQDGLFDTAALASLKYAVIAGRL